MPRGPYAKHAIYGIRPSVELSVADLKVARDAGCNVYAPTTLSGIFGADAPMTETYVRDVVIPAAIEELEAHFVPIRDLDGQVRLWATHQDSAEVAATAWHWFTATAHTEALGGRAADSGDGPVTFEVRRAEDSVTPR